MHGNTNLMALLGSFGFSEDEVYGITDELNVYRSIPGITVGRYINHIVDNINTEDRPAFLKGIMAGLTIKKADDKLSDPYSFEAHLRASSEIEYSGWNHWISLHKWHECE